jgi:glycosyltransferase involved in cell wall biosynthesis
MRVDQFIPAFHRGDAIGDTALHMRNFFRTQGYTSDIYCLNYDQDLEGEARLFSSFPAPAATDTAILHFALPSPLTQGLMRLPCKKAIIYHNITPHEFFAPFSREMANMSRAGRLELAALASRVDLALADSEFNRQELLKLGFQRAEVFELFIDFAKYQKSESSFVHDLFRDERTNILFVGRIAPNKKIEDLIRVVFYYKKYVSPLVRLIIVGKTTALPKYYESLVRLADEFYLQPEEIRFSGHIPDEEMFALYKASDVFLSLSEHEGFCLPLIESMVYDLPIIAYNCTAVPHTLDGSGVLITTKRADFVAELVDIVKHRGDLREKILQGQRDRLERFKAAGWEQFLLQSLRSLSG